MKTKILNDAHYNYTNKICQIIGFSNMADYTIQISYTTLKNNSATIATKINETFEQFKKLFELKYFNLSRLKYKIETISQIWSFIKKLFNYMNISFNTVRMNGDIKMRLINKNNLSIEYINKMANLEQKNETFSQDQEKNPKIMFSKILEKYKMKSYEKTYYIKTPFNLNNLSNDFDYFNYIQIININHPINIRYEIGGENINEEYFNNTDNKNYKFIINLPNSCFFIYHESTIKLINPNPNPNPIFKIIVNGFKFKSTIINYDKYTIEYDHEPKYYLFDYINLHSLNGMISKKYKGFKTKEDLDYYIKNGKPNNLNEILDFATKINKLIADKLLTETEFNFDGLKYNLITIDNNNCICPDYMYLCKLQSYPNFISNGNSIQLSNIIYDDFITCIIKNYTLPLEFSIVNNNNTVSNYYIIKSDFDLLKCIKILNKLELSNNEEVKIEIMCKEKVHIGTFKNDKLFEQIELKNLYNFRTSIYINFTKYLIITVNEKYFNDFEELNVNLGKIFVNENFCKKLFNVLN